MGRIELLVAAERIELLSKCRRELAESDVIKIKVKNPKLEEAISKRYEDLETAFENCIKTEIEVMAKQIDGGKR